MDYPSSTLLLSFFCLFSCSLAFNITDMLNDHKVFSTFNDYLTRTTLADQINKRQSLTVFAVDNAAMSVVSGKSMDLIRKVLSLHVALEYFDTSKLQNLSKEQSTVVPTLLQASGQSTGQQGFLKASISGTNSSTGGVLISSASNSDQSAHLIKSVVSRPYNISVIQISNAIIPNIISPPTAAPTHLPSKNASESSQDSPPKPGFLGVPNAAPGTGTADGSTAASPAVKSSGIQTFTLNYAFVISTVVFVLSAMYLIRLP